MKVLVTGSQGQLGRDLMQQLMQRGHLAMGCDVVPGCDILLDITDRQAVESAITREKPDAVIHCAAWTAVDAAEEQPETVFTINGTGTENIARACRAACCKMMYISTDYVFDGRGETPWQPDNSSYAPLNIYGRSKLAGEQAVSGLLEQYFIVRIAWVFGKHGKNFVKTMCQLGKKYDSLRVVSDQVGTPTYTPDLARLLIDMIETEKFGYYHATNEGGYISWYEFACEIFRQTGCDVQVIPVTTAEYGLSKAARPFNSRLDKSKLQQSGFAPLPHWQDALRRYLQEMEET